MGRLLALVIAAPIMAVCCAGGGALLAAVPGLVDGWPTRLGGIALVAAAGVGRAMARVVRQLLGFQSRRSTETELENA